MNPTQEQLNARVAATTPTISADTLTNPPTPIKIPAYTPPPVTPFVPALQTAVDNSLNDIKATTDKLGTASTRKVELENAQGIPAINSRIAELDAIDAQYGADLTNLASRELQNEVTADNATNYAPLRNALASRETRINIQKQQNINIKRATNAAARAAANGQLALAQDYVSRALEMEFEPLKAKLEFQKLLYTENKDRFSKAEQRDYEASIKASERVYEDKKENKTNILKVFETAARNGADTFTLSSIQRAETPEEAFKAAGQYAVSKDNQIVQLENGNTVIVDRMTGKVVSSLGGSKPKSVPSYAPSTGNPLGLTPLAQQVYNNPRAYHDLTPTDKAAVIAELQGRSPGWTVPKKLSAEQEKVVQSAEAGLLAISQLEAQLYNSDGSLNIKALGSAAVPIIGSFTRLGTAQSAAVDPITRIRTGAALTKDEERFYRRQIPRAGDTPELVDQKLSAMKAFYAGIAGTPVTLVGQDGKAYRYSDMFDPRQRLEVRKALEAGYKFVDY